jgi:hypothetical protein
MKQIKKIFLGSLALALLSISITAIEMSCTKSTVAGPTGVTGTVTGKLLYQTSAGSPNGNQSAFVITDYSGNVLDSISNDMLGDSLTLSDNFSANQVTLTQAALSPDGQYLFFYAELIGGPAPIYSLYKYDLNTHVLKVIRRTGYNTAQIKLQGAY